MRFACTSIAALCAGCSFIVPGSGPYELGRDAGIDSGVDGGAMLDAAVDSSLDAGPLCAPACTGPTPLCRAADLECVACLGDGDCGGATPRCALPAGACVACLDDGHCTDPSAARCDAGACVACTENAQCAGIAGLGVCAGGACVECTAADRSACGSNVCDGATRTCTDRAAASKDLCQPCIADAECRAGQLCVPMTFMAAPVGSYCLWREQASEGPAGDCSGVRPYVTGEAITSVDLVEARVCSLALTTCEALSQYRMRTCTRGVESPPPTDAECGVPGLDDALCRDAGDTLTRVCTVPCLRDDDCPAGSTCFIPATPPGHCVPLLP